MDGLFCNLEERRCQPLESLGGTCGSPNECLSNFCADGVCCDGPCNIACLTCALEGQVGTCTTQLSGNDPRGDCPGAATCGDAGFCEGAAKWAVRFGDDDDDVAVDVTLDRDGNIIVVGTYRGTIAFDNNGYVSNGGRDVFIVKLDGDGDVLWSQSFGGPGDDHVAGVEVDSSCKIVLAGDFAGTVDIFGSVFSTSLGERAPYVLRLGVGGVGACDHAATVDWVAAIDGVDGVASIADLSIAPDDSIAVIGTVLGELSLGSAGSLLTTSDTAWAAVVEADGSVAWGAPLGDGSIHGVAIDLDQDGNPVVAINGSGSFGMDTLMEDLAVAKLSDELDGAVQWQFLYDGDGAQWATALSVDGQNEVWLTGGYVDELVVPLLGELEGSDGVEGFYVKMRQDGAPVGSGRLPGPFDDRPLAVAIDEDNSAILAGSFELTVDLSQDNALFANGSGDMFVLALDDDANPIWGVPFGGELVDEAHALVLESADGSNTGDVIIVGGFEAEISFSTAPLIAKGRRDAFVAKLAR